MAVTMSDVARLAGVSIKTVSNVINDYPYISQATKAKVLDAIAELDYHPNLTARGLRSGRTGLIGLAVPNLSRPYFGQLADQVIQAAGAVGLVVLVEQTNGNRAREIEILKSSRLQMTDGLIMSPIGLEVEDMSFLVGESPVVLLGETLFNGPVDHVVIQNAEAAAAAVAHLISLGRRRIVALGVHGSVGPNSSTLRLQGYREALATAGIPFDQRLLGSVDRDALAERRPGEMWTRSAGAVAMSALMDTGVEFDGVFAMNDDLALGALRALQSRGKRVPEDVAVIGFDDVDEAQYSIPSLSTINPGRREIAQTAVQLLAERIAAESDGGPAPREIRPKFRVIARESTVGSSAR